METTPSSLNIAPEEQMRLIVEVSAGAVPVDGSSVTVNLGNSDCGNSNAQQTLSILPPVEQPLIDPLGRITGCSGELLADYQGFSVGLYEPDPSDPTGTELGEAVALTRTEVPDIQGNGIPQGLAPNTENINPYPLSNEVVQEFRGVYNFLFDEATGQLDQGRTYILVVAPPSDSNFAQRRIRLVLGDRNGEMVSYTATSLDGRPIGLTDGSMEVSGEIVVDDAASLGLTLGVMQLAAGVCDAQEVQITKTADRATAQPGDIVIYRLSVRNQSSTTLEQIVLFDQLPIGFNFIPKSVRGEIAGEEVTITSERNQRTVTFRGEDLVPPGEVLNIVYATELTPDSLRGSGENRAIVNAERDDNSLGVKDGPAIHRLRVDPGILSDCGTLIGRVFVDKNFDGEQQPGEPGVPNAVIYLEDGNRITTDADGLFSVASVLPGHHSGTLDLTSLPGYTLAPNHYFSERNSQSRLVRLEPGGMARMNFAVTPTFQESEN
ncbi:MAG: DUF11 domain-containing protein [Symploca sp. SIO2E9]|nr:DUF11 domain-containing protein [Symploca sp. SIO2E9]